MDFGATISRAFNLTLKHRVLWVLGFLAALAGGSGGGTSFNLPVPGGSFNPATPGGEIDPQTQRFFENLNPGALFAAFGGLLCVIVVISIALWVIGFIARGGLIGGVQQIEAEGSTTFSSAWSAGARKFWPLFGLNLLIAIPIILLALIGFVLVGGTFFALFAAAASGRTDDAAATGAAGGAIAALCIIFTLACVGVIYSIVASALQTFGERAIVIDNLGVGDALRRAWDVFRNNLGNIILLALLMLVISIVIGFIVAAISGVLFLPTILGAAANAEQGIGTGTIILAGITFLVVAIIGAIIGALYIAFNSATWTLAYRQFTDRGMITSSTTPAAPLPTV